MKKHVLFLTFLLAAFASGCEQYQIVPPEITEDVTFTDVQAIFTNKCAACHDGVTANPVLSEGSAYNALLTGGYIDTANAESSSLYVKLDGGDHKMFASDEDRGKILKWIEDGAPNN